MYFIERLVESFTRRISPQGFVRFAFAVSAFWLLALYPVSHWFFGERFPNAARMRGSDFGQYYMAALAARHGLWEHLYPVAKASVYGQPPEFRPVIANPFFDPNASASRQGNWIYYPQIARGEGGSIAPELLVHCPILDNGWRFVSPPPLALLLMPMGYVDYRVASSGIWFSLLCASFFGTGYFASRICRILWQKVSYAEGWVLLLPVIPTVMISENTTVLSVGNASPLLGFLISLVAFGWLANRQIAIGFGIVVLVLFKGIGLMWCPLLLLRPRKWRAIVTMALLALLLNGATLALGGVEIYRTFFQEVLPKAFIPVGIGVQSLALYFFGLDTSKLAGVVNLLLLAVLFWGYFRQTRASGGHPHPNLIIASLAGVIALFCLFNRVVWQHYYTIYLLLPFSGWILWEGAQAKGAWRMIIFVMLGASPLCWGDSLFLLKNSWLISQLEVHGLYSHSVALIRGAVNGFVVFVLPTMEFVFIFLLAIRRLFLFRLGEVENESAEPIRLVNGRLPV